MNEISNLTYRPEFQAMPTHDEVLRGMQNQLSDQMFYLSLILLAYIVLNMFVFSEGAKFRKYFDILHGEKFQIKNVGSIRDISYQVIETFAFMGAMTFVMLNLMYRGWINL